MLLVFTQSGALEDDNTSCDSFSGVIRMMVRIMIVMIMHSENEARPEVRSNNMTMHLEGVVQLS
jgi:hypothetical protein